MSLYIPTTTVRVIIYGITSKLRQVRTYECIHAHTCMDAHTYVNNRTYAYGNSQTHKGLFFDAYRIGKGVGVRVGVGMYVVYKQHKRESCECQIASGIKYGKDVCSLIHTHSLLCVCVCVQIRSGPVDNDRSNRFANCFQRTKQCDNYACVSGHGRTYV